jgi:hypothetical protein
MIKKLHHQVITYTDKKQFLSPFFEEVIFTPSSRFCFSSRIPRLFFVRVSIAKNRGGPEGHFRNTWSTLGEPGWSRRAFQEHLEHSAVLNLLFRDHFEPTVL